VRAEEERQQELALMKRRATGVLVLMTAVWIAITLTGSDATWVGYLRAGAEASMVGGLADWFAVTALFRHPLRIPIPHTAVIAERKDQFGETLGTFVQQNFLSADVIAERVRSSGFVARAAAWLAVPANAERVAAYTADALVGLADTIRDEDVHRVVEHELRGAVERVPLAQLGAQALRALTAEGRHQELFDAILRGLEEFLEQNRATLAERFDREAPWWLPDAVETRVFERLFEGIRTFVRDAANDPDHEARAHFTAWVESFAERLETSPELQARVDDLKHDLLARPELRTFSSSLWSDAKARLRAEACEPAGRVRRGLTDTIVTVGRRLQQDQALSRKAQELVESGVRFVAERFHDDLAQLVSGTIARWDGEETSHRLELLLGRDLQFIRINGTVVGGLAGLLIHGVGHLIS